MKNNIFPFWMTAASVFIAINILILSITLFADPAIYFEKLSFEDENMFMITLRLAAVFAALGLSVLLALFLQSVSILKITMIIYCLITLQDTVIGFSFDDTGLMIRSFIFCVLSAFIMFMLNGMKRKRKRVRFLKTTSDTSRTISNDDQDDDE